MLLTIALLLLSSLAPATGIAGVQHRPAHTSRSDSIAFGTGSSLPRTRGYVALVHDLLTQHDGTRSLSNLSRPGGQPIPSEQWSVAQLQGLITQLPTLAHRRRCHSRSVATGCLTRRAKTRPRASHCFDAFSTSSRPR